MAQGRSLWNAYEPRSKAIVRCPVLPLDFYQSLEKHKFKWTPVNRSRRDAGNRALVRSAIRLASPQLSSALDSDPWTENVYMKLVNYLKRMSTRPTPFGLFAGVATVEISDKTTISIGQELIRTHSRPDFELLFGLIAQLESRPMILHNLNLVANPAVLVKGGRVSLSETSPDLSGEANSVSLKATEPVKAVLEKSRFGATWNELMRLLMSMPHSTRERGERLLLDLLRCSVLTTDLRPPLSGQDPSAYMISRLSKIRPVPKELDQLKKLLELIRQFDRCELWAKGRSYDKVVRQAMRLSPQAKVNIVQVDSELLLNRQSISREIAREFAVAAELLLRMSPYPNGNPSIINYRRRYVERYGDEEAPLLEVIDPDLGIGLPDYQKAGLPSFEGGAWKARDQTLLAIATSAIRRGTKVINLDHGAMVDKLSTNVLTSHTAPCSMDLIGIVAGRSEDDVNKGRFEVLLGPSIGHVGAGSSITRFSHVVGRQAISLVNEIVHDEQQIIRPAVRVEVGYIPKKLWAANVATRPRLGEYELAVGSKPSRDWAKTVYLADLVVGVRNDRFYVRRKWSEERLSFSSTTMVNSEFAPPICRLLLDITQDGLPAFLRFDWGSAESLPFLPRVRYGRITLRMAQWRIDRTLTEVIKPPKVPNKRDLRKWRRDWRVPRLVLLRGADQTLVLDLENSDDQNVLLEGVRRLSEGDFLFLEEAPFGEDQVWVKGPAGRHIAEFSVPLVLGSANWTRQEIPRPSESVWDGHSTGDNALEISKDWLYIKLYCTKWLEEDVIADSLWDFAQSMVVSSLVDGWFFVRYSDPRAHIRVRFKAKSPKAASILLPELYRWAAQLVASEKCNDFAIETYKPEIGRYGGREGLSLAEEIFMKDSLAAVPMIRLLRQNSRLDRIVLAALSVDRMLVDLGLSPMERKLFCRDYRESNQMKGSFDEGYDSRLRLLGFLLNKKEGQFDVGYGRAHGILESRRKRMNDVGNKSKNLFARKSITREPNNLYRSWVHMHLNRLLGPNQFGEYQAITLLYRALQRQIALK